MFRSIASFVVGCMFIAAFHLFAQETLTNEKITQLVESKLSEELILTLIANSPSNFKTDIDSILALKGKGVSEKVIQAMVSKAATPPEQRATSAPALQPSEGRPN